LGERCQGKTYFAKASKVKSKKQKEKKLKIKGTGFVPAELCRDGKP
jgi:hypothetical protein